MDSWRILQTRQQLLPSCLKISQESEKRYFTAFTHFKIPPSHQQALNMGLRYRRSGVAGETVIKNACQNIAKIDSSPTAGQLAIPFPWFLSATVRSESPFARL
jgi:hypothetical protein